MRFASAAGRPGTPRVTSAGTRRSRSTAIGTKQLTPSVRGFRTMKTTYATTKGFEVMLSLRKGRPHWQRKSLERTVKRAKKGGADEIPEDPGQEDESSDRGTAAGRCLSQPLEDRTVQEITHALLEHQELFLRGQDINLEAHKAFGRRFGTLYVHPTAPAVPGHREVLVIHADENSNVVAGMKWHSDVSWATTPPMGSILHLLTVPESGGDTLIANMYTAYEALSEPVKELIGQLSAWHESTHVSEGRFGNRAGTHDGVRQYPKALHPMVTKHRVTGRECLFVNENYTTRIEGLAERESQAILKMLYDHITAPEFQTRFHWEPNSIAFWDNRCVQHRSEWDYYPATRHGYRMTVCDDAARGQL